MKVFIWTNINKVSYNYHDDGGIVIVAESLERAREMMRVIDGETTNFDHKKGKAVLVPTVPEKCGAFTTDPTLILETTHNKEEMFIFPDAGCC
jgi:hypothetical protein